MQRYFVQVSDVDEQKQAVMITGDDVSHIGKVMRFSEGDRIICCDGVGNCYLTAIKEIQKHQVLCAILERIHDDRELPVHVTIAQGLPKGDKMDLIVQKATELGVRALIPFTSSRTIVQLDDKKQVKRLERWNKIAKEASEQSHRQFVPEISGVFSWKQLLKIADQYDLALLAFEGERVTSMYSYMQNLKGSQRILIIVGPEGGFSEEEVAEAEAAGFNSVMLGNRILRTETAALYALSCISYQFEQIGELM
ncbi:16S rRNA (uracil(1498)-N(3))-methyltransferase [Ammoniphilus resinae]|uniref:Ribosomal RNA small subunit methyltransferase E n=1 Tax=Ammoniphilus resinae TaxID=861532 RepID=A0ABS4GJS8_9BACL|nr:16S rRNA (uracil(1498)-N(3))-methyltransferase [Ammoniphilus resinae]MBP1930513.1 16S rRNA (uracil1498-N3)-methyltransferase [Ammoniphilus resinae]